MATTAGLVLGGIPFFLVLLNFRLDPLRTAVAQRFASNFFDAQATAFLDGRLSVPDGSLGIESFVIDGKTYMYFPPFPALLRIPMQLLTHELDGRLTVVSMALAWVILAAFSTRLVWLVRDCLRPGRPVGRTDGAVAAILLAAITGGTVLTFDAALPWVFHEVYLWASSLAVASAYWLLRVALEPTRSSILRLSGFLMALALTRTPGGLALSGATIALGAWTLLRHVPALPSPRESGPGPATRSGLRSSRSKLARSVVAAGALPAAASVTYNWVKFHHPYLFPLQSQVWTEVNAHRRQALEVNGGTITGPQFFETTLVNYFRPDGIRFVDYFPWITLPAEPAPAYGGAFVDQTYRTGSVTAFMPLLFLLCLAAIPVLLRRRPGREVAALRWPAVGTILIGGAVMGYGYLANRYTSDFVPALVVVGTIGAWHLVTVLQNAIPLVRRGVVALMAALCAFSVLAQMATGALVAAQTHRGPELTSFLSLQERLSGGPDSAVARLVSRSPTLPARGRADELHVVGNCAALYVHTGDQYEPWNLVEQRRMEARVTPTFVDYRPGLLPLFDQKGLEPRQVALEFDRDVPQARLVIVDPDGNFVSPWFEVARGRTVRVTAEAVPELFQTRLRVDDDPRFDLYLPVAEWNEDWYNEPSQLAFVDSREPDSTDHVRVSNIWGPVPELCGRLTNRSVVTK